MKTLNDYISSNLFFVQEKRIRNYYELKSGEEFLGTLIISGLWKNKCVVKTFGNEYLFIQPSFWRKTVEIKKTENDSQIAVYRRSLFKNFGFINLSTGEILKVNFNIHNSSYEIKNSFDETIVSYINKFPFQTRTEVYVNLNSPLLETNPWLIFVPYFIVLTKRNKVFK